LQWTADECSFLQPECGSLCPQSGDDDKHYEHIGVYAFRKQALINFTKWPVTPLEAAEKIECLRYLEHGIPLKMVLTEYMGIEIDTPEDLLVAKQWLD
jgi:3-deoxy-manno-octulosonate cytidylyltransferase (CMP-KDO synthetase)